MAAYTFRAAGATDQHNGSCTPPVPAGLTAGDLMLIHGCTRNNGATLNSIPTGWTDLSPHVHDTYNYLLARIADGTAGDAAPTLVWTPTANAQAQMACWFGDVYTDLTTIVHSSIDQSGPGAGASGNDILYSALGVTLPNCLIIARGMHNKTTTSNAAPPVLAAIAGFTEISQQNIAGPVFSAYWGYEQQAAATNVPSVVQIRTTTVESLQQNSLVIALKTLAAGASSAAKAFTFNQQNANNG